MPFPPIPPPRRQRTARPWLLSLGLFGECAALMAARGITVNTVSARAVETEVWQTMPEGTAALAGIRARTPGSALVTPEAVAEVVFFLASPVAQAVQGQVLAVDGGYSLLA